MLPLTSASEICLGCTISKLWFFLLSKLLWLTTNMESQIRVILKVREFTISKWWIRDKFRLQKLGITKGFLKVKVLSDFDFGQFLRNWSQRHLVGKLLKVQKSPRYYQYVSLVCKIHSNSQEDFVNSFFHFEMNSGICPKGCVFNYSTFRESWIEFQKISTRPAQD